MNKPELENEILVVSDDEEAKRAAAEICSKAKAILDSKEEEPETFSSDRKPVKIPRRIIKIRPGYEDPLAVKDMIFGVNGFGYKVSQVLGRMRRRIELLGLIVPNPQSGQPELRKIPDGVRDPLVEHNFVFSIAAHTADPDRGVQIGDNVAYRINNSNGRYRTIKFMGKLIYDVDMGEA